MAMFNANITSALTQYSINNDWEAVLLNKKVSAGDLYLNRLNSEIFV